MSAPPEVVVSDGQAQAEPDDDGRSDWLDKLSPVSRFLVSPRDPAPGLVSMVEAEGFEPSVPCGTAVFKTAAGPAQGTRVQGDASAGSSVLVPCMVFLREKRPDLAELVAAWDRLPAPLRSGILAMIRATR